MIKNLLQCVILMLLSGVGWSSEIIVCAPVELSYQQSKSKLTIYSKGEVTGDGSGVVCNSSGSWCSAVSIKPRISLSIEVPAAEFTNPLIFYQTEYNAKNEYGGCKWRVSM